MTDTAVLDPVTTGTIETTTPETGASTEAPVLTSGTNAAADVSESATVEAPKGDRARGPDGRFIPKDAGQAPVDAGAPDTSGQPPAEAPAEPAGEPFTVTVHGQRLPWEGVQYVPGKGTFFPDKEIGELRRLLARGVEADEIIPQQIKQYRDEIATLKAQAETAQSEIAAENEVLRTELNRQAQAGWLDEPAVDLLLTKIENAKLKARNGRPEAQPATAEKQPEQAAPEPVESAQHAIVDHLDRFRLDAAYRGVLTPEDWQEIEQDAIEEARLFLVNREGQWLFNDQKLKTRVERVRKYRDEQAKERSKTAEIARAAAANAKREAGATAPPPQQANATPQKKDAHDGPPVPTGKATSWDEMFKKHGIPR